MARESTPETVVERLVRYLFGGVAGAGSSADAGAGEAAVVGAGAGSSAAAGDMAGELSEWLASSPRFRAFAEANRDKIRKKLRGAADQEARRDVRAELRTAHLLLADRWIELAFEAYGSGRGGPDFTVVFRGVRSFNLEVTRLRRTPDLASYGGPLLAKLRQLPPSVPNAVLIAIDRDGTDAVDVEAAVRALRARADTKDEGFFAGRGFEGSRGFYERFLRLGAVFVLGEAAAEPAAAEGGIREGRASLWVNRSARIELPPRAARACLLALQSG
jgi:hypothetical protein